MASWLAIIPPGRIWLAPSTVVATCVEVTFCTTPCESRTTAASRLNGTSTRIVPRVRSTQKLPMVADRARTNPRMRATATESPTAAETKFCTASAPAWVR